MILRRIEHLEQRRRRITAPVVADLVDFIEHDHRVARARLFEGAGDPARQGTDVGAAMSPDLGFVVNAAERNSRELATKRPGNRLAQRGLADARRSDQRDDRAGAAATDDLQTARVASLANSQKLDNPVLDVVKPGVILIEDAACFDHVELVHGPLVPGHVEHPIQVISDPAGLGILLAGSLEPV